MPAVPFPFPGRVLPLPAGTFRALGHRDFRLLWSGQAISLVGGWMQHVARGWLVLRLSDSAWQLGLVGFFTFIPVLLFALPAGVAADRLPRRRLLVWTQSLAALFSAILGLLTISGRVEVWQIAAIAFAMGSVGAFDIPLRQSLLQDLVGKDDLPNAIALNSLAFNGARLLGPALAGVLLAFVGEGTIFLINAVSYLAVVIGVVRMRTPHVEPTARAGSWLRQIGDGLDYARREPRTRVILLLVVVTSIFATPYTVLLPVFARDIHGVGSSGLGWLTSAAGFGAMIGALTLAGRTKRLRAGRVVAIAMASLGLGLIVFSQLTRFPAALACLVLVGAAMIVQMATSNTVLQLLAPPELRGRVVSLYMLGFLGMAPFGSLLAGSLAGAFGAPNAVLLGGGVCLLCAAWFATRIPSLRAAARRFENQPVEQPLASTD